MGMRSIGGEIVEVEGGHIVRSIGRKDRHNKVYSSKGPHDRRVRLSAHTAIELYDVQDRFLCDRPNKFVDWLIKKAKPSIDKLVEFPQSYPKQPYQKRRGLGVLDGTTQCEERKIRRWGLERETTSCLRSALRLASCMRSAFSEHLGMNIVRYQKTLWPGRIRVR